MTQSLDIPAAFAEAASLVDARKFAEAKTLLLSILEVDPRFLNARFALAVVCEEMAAFDDAAESYRALLQHKPDFSKSHEGLARICAQLGRLDEAAQHYERTVALSPENAGLHNNLGLVYADLGELDRAITCFKKATELKPDLAVSHFNLGSLLRMQGDLESACKSFERALDLNPEYWISLVQYLHTKDHMCDWRIESKYLDAFSSYLRALAENRVTPEEVSDVFPLLLKTDDPLVHRHAAELYGRRFLQPARAMQTFKHDEKIKLAYVSADFGDHPVAYQAIEVFELHDREQFELYAFSYGTPCEDSSFRQRIESALDHFEDVSQLPDAAIADRIQQQGIHIAVDLTGYTAKARPGILASRPAPVQVNYLGYPCTMAVPSMDFIIADETVIPEQERSHYTEQIAYLPTCYFPQDRKRKIASPPTRTDVGLPEDAFVFCCFNSAQKITAQQFDVWCDILKAVPGSVLWLAEGNRWSAGNLKKEAGARGIDENRLIFAPKLTTISNADHLARVSLADLFLDTYPYAAHATGCDSLLVGVPIVTKTGRSFASRVSASLLKAVGLPEMVTKTDKDYRALAIDLADDPETLQHHRARLNGAVASAPLFDTHSYVTALESQYKKMWERYLAGERPSDLRPH